MDFWSSTMPRNWPILCEMLVRISLWRSADSTNGDADSGDMLVDISKSPTEVDVGIMFFNLWWSNYHYIWVVCTIKKSIRTKWYQKKSTESLYALKDTFLNMFILCINGFKQPWYTSLIYHLQKCTNLFWSHTVILCILNCVVSMAYFSLHKFKLTLFIVKNETSSLYLNYLYIYDKSIVYRQICILIVIVL